MGNYSLSRINNEHYIVGETTNDEYYDFIDELTNHDARQQELYNKKISAFENRDKTLLIVSIIAGIVGIIIFFAGNATENPILSVIGISIALLAAILWFIRDKLYPPAPGTIINVSVPNELYNYFHKAVEAQFSNYLIRNNGLNNYPLPDDKIIWKDNDEICMSRSFQNYFSSLINRLIQNNYNLASILNSDGTFIKNYGLNAIPIDNIKYYTCEGDVQYTTNISGGGGGGSSISGAIIGGVIAGAPGAIIGSRKPIEAIKSQTETHDSRQVILKYEEDGRLYTMTFPISVFDTLEALIPEKEYRIVMINRGNNL